MFFFPMSIIVVIFVYTILWDLCLQVHLFYWVFFFLLSIVLHFFFFFEVWVSPLLSNECWCCCVCGFTMFSLSFSAGSFKDSVESFLVKSKYDNLPGSTTHLLPGSGNWHDRFETWFLTAFQHWLSTERLILVNIKIPHLNWTHDLVYLSPKTTDTLGSNEG